MSSDSIKKHYQQKVFTNDSHLIYLYKQDLAFTNLQWLICHKTKPNQTNLSLAQGEFFIWVKLIWIQRFPFS